MNGLSVSNPRARWATGGRGTGRSTHASAARARLAVRMYGACLGVNAAGSLDSLADQTRGEDEVAGVTVHERPFGRQFEDFEVGDVYRHWPGKTITEYDDHLFCMITMNHHPLHTNERYAQNETVQKQNVVVGNLVYSLVLGMSVPDVSGAAVANLKADSP